MTWVKVDDGYPDHPKLIAAGPLGQVLWFAGLAYCNRNLTDGFIPWSVAQRLIGWTFLDDQGETRTLFVGSPSYVHEDNAVTSDYVIEMLIGAGLWTEAKGGYQVHDYADYQPTKAHVLEERERRSNAGIIAGKASAARRATSEAIARHVMDQRNGQRTVERVVDDVPNDVPNDSATNGQRFFNPVPVPVPLTSSSSKKRVDSPLARPRTDLQIVRDWFAEHGYRYPSGWAKTSLSEMVGVLGRENVLRMLADAQRSGVKLSADLVRWIEREAAPSNQRDKPTGSGDADRERFDRGVAATQREIARTRHDA